MQHSISLSERAGMHANIGFLVGNPKYSILVTFIYFIFLSLNIVFYSGMFNYEAPLKKKNLDSWRKFEIIFAPCNYRSTIQ